MERYRPVLLALLLVGGLLAALVDAQPPRRNRRAPWEIEPTEETKRKVRELIGEVHDVELTLNVKPNVSRLIQTKRPILRFSITDPSVLDIVQYSPTEFEIIGLRHGITSLTIWYAPSGGDGLDLPEAPRKEVGREATPRIVRFKR
jgi:Flp pilus assembly secretin CpaC